MNKRKICIVTTTRAEYGLLKPVMEKIRESKELSLQLVAAGMHLLPEFGFTIKEIEKDGFKVDATPYVIIAGDSKEAMTSSIGAGVISFCQVFSLLKPNIVLLLGDRFEVFSAAIAASYSGKIVAHLSGGDVTKAGYDEYTRHAITKISHIHFPSTKKSAERIIRMGENPEYVFPVGSTAIDTIVGKRLPSKECLCKRYKIPEKEPFVLLLQHPLSTHPQRAEEEIRQTLEALLKIKIFTFAICPNVDPGGRRMMEVLLQYGKVYKEYLKVYRSIPFEDYLAIMREASVMVGNSSSGIIEAPSFHLPVVNIGSRQEGRERVENVIDAPYDKRKIEEAIRKTLFDEDFKRIVKNCKNPYGDGKASERIVKILESVDIDKLREKKFHER